MSRYPVITQYPVVKGWITVREAAVIYGNIIYGRPVTIRAMQAVVSKGKFRSTRTVSQHFIILRRSEVEKVARQLKAQGESTMAATKSPVHPPLTEEQVKERLGQTPPPPWSKE